MKHAKGKLFATLCLLMTLFVLFGPYGDTRVSAVDTATYKSLKIFNEVLDIVEKNYVEEVKQKKLIEEAVNGMIKSLDPHSAYLTPDLMGGTDSQMIANVIERQFKRANDWPFGAALSFMLIYAMFALIALQGLRKKREGA